MEFKFKFHGIKYIFNAIEYIFNAMEFKFKFHGIKYINLLYIYLLLLYNGSILDIEHSPYYIALGSPQTHKMI